MVIANILDKNPKMQKKLCPLSVASTSFLNRRCDRKSEINSQSEQGFRRRLGHAQGSNLPRCMYVGKHKIHLIQLDNIGREKLPL